MNLWRSLPDDGGDACHAPAPDGGDTCHTSAPRRFDYLLWGSLAIVAVLYAGHFLGGLLGPADAQYANVLWELSASVVELVHRMWWGILLAVAFIGLLGKVPREFVVSALGGTGGLRGMLRATFGGLLLDLCNHGVLMVATRLYERGLSGGQMIAFLVASPWNSLSLTLILIALVGLPMTLAFTLLSFVVAVITGLIYERLVAQGRLPDNPNQVALPEDFRFWPQARAGLRACAFDRAFFAEALVDGVKESRMVMRWLLFGIVLASLVRVFVDTATFETWFGPTLMGLGMTIVAATIIEVCSEGSAPIAADLVTRANAPGNGFAFLMAGAATDYTEVMVLREATASWKFALFLPLITLPQVLLLAWLLNTV